MFGFIGDLAGAGTFVFEGFINPSAISSHLLKRLEIGTKPFVSSRTVLKAFEIRFELKRASWRKAVNHPGPMSCAFNHALLAEVGEMLGNFRLWDIENFLEMADAKRTPGKQLNDPQPRGIAETLINLNQFHRRNMDL